jgi:hypothetical protein
MGLQSCRLPSFAFRPTIQSRWSHCVIHCECQNCETHMIAVPWCQSWKRKHHSILINDLLCWDYNIIVHFILIVESWKYACIHTLIDRFEWWQSESCRLSWSYFLLFLVHAPLYRLQQDHFHWEQSNDRSFPFEGTIDVSSGSISYIVFDLTGPLGILLRKLESILL